MSNSNVTFESVIDGLIRREGGYVNSKNDPGGETRWGISKRYYPHLDIKNLTVEQAKAIYRKDYWGKLGADKLPAHMREIAFDAAVNQGVGATKNMLAEAGNDVGRLIDLRLQRYKATVDNDKTGRQKHNYKGWLNRIGEFQVQLGLPRLLPAGQNAPALGGRTGTTAPTAPTAPAVKTPVANAPVTTEPKASLAQGALDAISQGGANLGDYWERSNADFESGNPGAIDRLGRAISPLTGVGSGLGAFSKGLKEGDALAATLGAASSFPLLAAGKAIKTLDGLKTVVNVGATAGRAGSNAAIGGMEGLYENGTGASNMATARDKYLDALAAGVTPLGAKAAGLTPATPTPAPNWVDGLKERANMDYVPGMGLPSVPTHMAEQAAAPAQDWQSQMADQQAALQNQQSQSQDAALAAMFGTGQPKPKAAFDIPSSIDRYLDKQLGP